MEKPYNNGNLFTLQTMQPSSVSDEVKCECNNLFANSKCTNSDSFGSGIHLRGWIKRLHRAFNIKQCIWSAHCVFRSFIHTWNECLNIKNGQRSSQLSCINVSLSVYSKLNGCKLLWNCEFTFFHRIAHKPSPPKHLGHSITNTEKCSTLRDCLSVTSNGLSFENKLFSLE